jgi:addiction module RelE/StbE family toxin
MKKVVILHDTKRLKSSVALAKRRVPKLPQILTDFLKFKKTNPKQPYNTNDDALKGGELKNVGLRHFDIGREYRLYYRVVEDSDSIKVILYGVFTHEETGTGRPPNQNKQKSFADTVRNAENRLTPVSTDANRDPVIERYFNWIKRECQLWN